MLDLLRQAVLEWYTLLSGVSGGLSGLLGAAARQWNVPAVSAVLFGVVGSLAPCQVTANVSAMAYLSRRAGERQGVWPDALAYVWGKVLVYTLLGAAAIALGLQLPPAAMAWVRKLMGPFLILFALHMLQWVRLRFTLGEGLSRRLQQRLFGGGGADGGESGESGEAAGAGGGESGGAAGAPGSGRAGAFLLGGVYSLAFCPTMALLFFGLLVPLGLRSRAGLLLPPFFGLGTAVPLLVFAALLALGRQAAPALIRGTRHWERALRLLVAAVFVVAGVHDLVVYWLL